MVEDQNSRLLVFILSLKELPGIGPKTICNILTKHHNLIGATPILDANFADKLGIAKLCKALRSSTIAWEELEDRAKATISIARQEGIYVLHPFMPEYPSRLLRNKNFPPVLFCKGDISALNSEKSMAIIGTRAPTNLGASMGRRLARLMSEEGYVIISGLALGSDTAGHLGALDANGKTIAVLPIPLDSPVYPKQNQKLADRIVECGGALVSEYAPGTQIDGRQLAGNLIARDEWQPALADGIVVIETTLDGGSNHALKHAWATNTPIAAFDYTSRNDIDFLDDRFAGNVSYLARQMATPIYGPATIDAFKKRMDEYRLDSTSFGVAKESLQQLALKL